MPLTTKQQSVINAAVKVVDELLASLNIVCKEVCDKYDLTPEDHKRDGKNKDLPETATNLALAIENLESAKVELDAARA
jgi:hypothetical protein